jgi:prepilin-type N-terminal cleavage/methylation domain-containing protein
MKSRLVSSSKHGSYRRSGFTLVEILVVMGIIAVILSIALPVTFKARRQAAKTRAARDLGALATALDEFRNNNGEYPQIGYPFLPPPPPNPNPNSANGSQALYCALVGKDMRGNAISNGKSGRPVGAMINVESFRVTLGAISDSNSKAYLYFPGRVPTPNIRDTTKKLFVDNNAARTQPLPLYNYADAGVGFSFTAPVPSGLAAMQTLLGDSDYSGNINGAEVPATTAPFLLWAAGPDGIYGLDVNGKCDDATNFDIPAQYIR